MLICICNKLQAPHSAGSFISHSELNKFVGDWKWGSGADSVMLHFEKQFIHYPTPLSYDEVYLVGWHKYKKTELLSKLNYNIVVCLI